MAASVARRLCEALRERPFTLADGTVAVTGSVGCAWSAGPARLSDLLDRADAALYRAKRAGRDRVAQAWKDVTPLNRWLERHVPRGEAG